MITIENITIQYNNIPIINQFSAHINKGEKVVFTGQSGTGKTTLINSLLGFIPFRHGIIQIMGKNLTKDNIQEIRKNIAYLPQELFITNGKVYDILYEPFTFKYNKEFKPNKQQIIEMLNILDLEEKLLNKEINQISGGQKQRILLASAFLLQKPIIILDEPTTGLDDENINRISAWLNTKKNVTILSTSHNKAWIENSSKTYNLENYGTYTRY